MRCVDCEYCQYLDYTYFCNIWKKSYRISREDAQKDVPCWKYDRRRKTVGMIHCSHQGADMRGKQE